MRNIIVRIFRLLVLVIEKCAMSIYEAVYFDSYYLLL